ncbi:MAG: PRC-barrel domain-containing protein [Cyanobacteria bacterium P01_A01_bin.45]
MTSEQIIRRSDILNTQVITRNNGKRLGIVNQVWIDVDQREVVAFGLRDSLISVSGIPRYMYLERVNQIGDVVLVDDEDVIEDIDVDMYSNLMNWEVITETGETLGRVRGFKFNANTGEIYSIVIASLGLPQIPEQVLSTYELSIEEVMSVGPSRLIVLEGAEERTTQLSVGLLERLGIGSAPWANEDDYGYTPRTIAPPNQLPSGVPLEAPRQKIRRPEPIAREEWDEDVIEEPRRRVMEAQAYEPEPPQTLKYEEEEEEDNWSEATDNSYQKPITPQPLSNPPKSYESYDEDDLDTDIWDNNESPKPINIPKKVKEKQPEYEEEGGY